MNDATVCWCGLSYIRGVCPLHGVMRDPRTYGGVTNVSIDESISDLPLTYLTNAIGANVTLPTSSTFFDGPTVTLSPGLWLCTFSVVFARTTTTAVTYFARLTDKSTHYASGQQYHASVANHYVQMSMTAVVSTQATRQIWGQGATSAGSSGSTMRYQLSGTGFGGNTTMLTAVKIG